MKKFNKVCHPEQSKGSQKLMRFFGFHPQNDKKAFTLAEILITLGVIGVVAAMTLPTVIHKIQMSVLQTQFKKTYSALSNAIEKTKVDTEYSLRCYGDNDVVDCREFHNKFQSQFKVIKVCENNAYSKGCIGNIKGVNTFTPDKKSDVYNKNIVNYSLYESNGIKNILYTFVTSGGFSVSFYRKDSRSIYLVDTNGPKKPNKWGYDVFSFSLNNTNTKLTCSNMLSNFFEQGGKGCVDMITNRK